MAINIFSGTGSGNKNKKSSVNSAQNSVRAKQARAALSPTAEVSSSGNTAVESKGTLSKIGNVVGKVAGIAGKFLPGVGGVIANGISNLLNDPEWWQSVPGDALTLNEPLRMVAEPTVTGSGTDAARQLRIAILEFTSPQARGVEYETVPSPTKVVSQFVNGVRNTGRVDPGDFAAYDLTVCPVITPSEKMVTQYLMPHVRKVVNAITLQSADDYAIALQSGATLYGLWRELRKIDYMAKHGQTYLANMNDNAFPLLQTANASWLQSTINRLEEYLRANVRLPHTLCEYLAWRYGRVYKSNDSKKSALVVYNILGFECTPAVWDYHINALMSQITAAESVQKANTDLYNTYFDHDFMVEVRDDTQFSFDKKEFMLRLNLTAVYAALKSQSDYTFEVEVPQRATLVALDSALDNPTAFMASTVSSVGYDQDGTYEVLVPTDALARVYWPRNDGPATADALKMLITLDSPSQSTFAIGVSAYQTVISTSTSGKTQVTNPTALETGWYVGFIQMDQATSEVALTSIASHFIDLILAKSVDLYNIRVTVPVYQKAWNGTTPANGDFALDVSALSIDAGSPTLSTINTEHVYAFANLTDVGRKTSMSYKQAEHLVAKDTAEMIDKLDVAAVATDANKAK